ncbi:DNA mismatch repair protein MutH [Gammaproteobacteria bacterium]|nr:DNA mismatch repair protein MutH [Gammaproteobacteria bacterium]
MKISEAYKSLLQFTNCTLNDVFKDSSEWKNLKDSKNAANKGLIGQLLMTRLGLKNDNRVLDLEDGEIKTNDVYPNGQPKESIKITQFSSKNIDLLIGANKLTYNQSHVFLKLNSCLYILKNQYTRGKVGGKSKAVLLPQEKWHFKKPFLLQNNLRSKDLFKIFEDDYDYIVSKIEGYLRSDEIEKEVSEGNRKYIFKTTNGKYLQARTAGGKPKTKKNPKGVYTPVYSEIFKKELCNKPIAIYFQAKFIRAYVEGELDKFI